MPWHPKDNGFADKIARFPAGTRIRITKPFEQGPEHAEGRIVIVANTCCVRIGDNNYLPCAFWGQALVSADTDIPADVREEAEVIA